MAAHEAAPSRRDALCVLGAGAVAVGAGLAFGEHGEPSPASKKGPLPRRELGRTGVEVSILALGGYHLGTLPDEKAATRLVHAALDAGLDFFDNAWEYHQGKSETWLGSALAGKRDRAFVMTKVCTHGRGKQTALEQLEQSLKRLRTDHVDLWQVHEVIYDNDPALHYANDGVLEALALAKKQGKARFVGFTGHKSPALHLEMLKRGFPFDTVQMPLNPFDGQFRSFENDVLPKLVERGVACLGMKSLSGDGAPIRKGVLKVEEALRYALSLPIASLVSGIDSMDVLEQNLAIARAFTPMRDDERAALRRRVAAVAADGRDELYKTSMGYDGPPGREQHGFPSDSPL